VPLTQFYANGWKRLKEASTGQRSADTNPVLFGAAYVARVFGVGKTEVDVSQIASTPQQTSAAPVQKK
jgi:hypothetical protein